MRDFLLIFSIIVEVLFLGYRLVYRFFGSVRLLLYSLGLGRVWFFDGLWNFCGMFEFLVRRVLGVVVC